MESELERIGNMSAAPLADGKIRVWFDMGGAVRVTFDMDKITAQALAHMLMMYAVPSEPGDTIDISGWERSER